MGGFRRKLGPKRKGGGPLLFAFKLFEPEMQRKEWNHDIYRKKAECRSLEVKRIEFVKAGAVKEKEQLSYHVGGAHWRSG